MPTLTELAKDGEEMENLLALYEESETKETFEKFVERLKSEPSMSPNSQSDTDRTLYDWAKEYNPEKENRKKPIFSYSITYK